MTEPIHAIDKVGLCVLRAGRLLLARSRGSTVFQIPGGKVEARDADDIAALVREIREELGVCLDPTSVEWVGLFSAPAAGRAGVVVNVKLFRGDFAGEIEAQSEIEELIWIDPAAPGAIEISAVVSQEIIPYLVRESRARG